MPCGREPALFGPQSIDCHAPHTGRVSWGLVYFIFHQSVPFQFCKDVVFGGKAGEGM